MTLKKVLFAGLVALLPHVSGGAERPLNVVTTTTDLADIVQQIGGDRVKVESLSKGFQNPHFVEAKPSLVVKLTKADVFIQTGFELEVGWAPLLVQNARNKNILPGGSGFIDASEVVKPLEVPSNPNRSMGDVHPQGNPHFMTDPKNAVLVAKLIAEKLSALAPADAGHFSARAVEFEKDIEERLRVWGNRLAPYKGTAFVSYHRDWIYFAERFGLVSAGEMEPKPGIPPTAAHTAELIKLMKARKVGLIFMDPWYEKQTAAFIAKETGAQILSLALFPGAQGKNQKYQDAIDYNISTILNALHAGKN